MGTIGDTGEGSACTHGRLAWVLPGSADHAWVLLRNVYKQYRDCCSHGVGV
jgi:hypothetical protein